MPRRFAASEAVPGSVSYLMPDVGHLCNVEAADDINEMVTGFVREHST